MLILYITNVQDFLLQLNFTMLLNVQCMQCDTVKVAMETWHFGSVNGVSDGKTFALHYCETPFYPHFSAPLVLSWEVGDRKKAMAWNLHESGLIGKKGC